MHHIYTVCVLITFIPGLLLAKPEISVDQIVCLPVNENGVITAQVKQEPPAAIVRIYFRRLNAYIEDFYYVLGQTKEKGKYWGTLPIPEKNKLYTPQLRRGWAAWWIEHEESKKEKEYARDWLHALDQKTLQQRLTKFHVEPVEYYGAMFDVAGRLLARSDIKVAPIVEGCETNLTEQQQGERDNLVIGETTATQGKESKKLFHWQCAGVVTRIDPNGIRRADVCRNRFIASWKEEDWLEGKKTRGRVADKDKSYQSVEVFYGTDRNWLNEDQQSWVYKPRKRTFAYGIERGNLELGTLQVSIPATHQKGELEGLGLFELTLDPDEHVVLLRVDRTSREQFISQVQRRVRCPLTQQQGTLQECEDDKKSALVFIHGYNVSFEDAARRTAQIAYDLEFGGVPLFYSWPSQGSIPGYTVDEANIRWTVPHLEEFLTLLTEETQAETVHLIAHSMGNRAVTEVLRRFATEKPPIGRPRFNQIVLVAPDIDAAVFRDEIAPAFSGVGERITLYASSFDKALNVSKGLHQYPRAGDLSEGVMMAMGVDTIDASDVDTSLLRAIRLGHSYFAKKASAIADLKETLAGTDPNNRARKLERCYPKSGGMYWKILGGETPCR